MVVNWNAVGIFAAFAIYGAFAAYTLRRPLAKVLARLRAMPRISQVAACVFVAVATVQAQKQSGSTNEPPLNAPGPAGGLLGGMHVGQVLRPLPQLRIIGGGGVATVSDEDVVRGYCMVCETNDACHAYAMPTNAAFLGNAHIRGAASGFGMNVVDFGAWSFPFGSNGVLRSRLWWFPDGRVRALPHDAADEISAGVEGALAVQGESRLWWAEGEDDCRILTWEGVFAGGDTNAALNLQVVLGGGGDRFETWSNEVGRVYARLDSDDWDGDGLDNAIDALPTASDGDCFGTGVDWLNANCSGVLSASEDTNGEIVVAWHTNSNENAYYWLQFTATRDRTRVTIECDGPSNLGDMLVIANSNQVCRVPLLIGARYHVRASPPVDDVSVSDPEAFISYLRSVGEFYVERPIELYFAGDDDSGTIVSDPDIGVVIGAITGNCCEVSFNAYTYTWTCCASCHCTGYGQNWNVSATWEGYSKLFQWLAQCDCQAENEANPEVWATLSATPVVMRGGWLGGVSANFNPPESALGATASLRLDGGGKVVPWGTANRTGAVSLPMSIPPSGSGSFWLEGVTVSDTVGDVRVYLDVTAGEDTYTLTQSVTVARVDRMEMTSSVSETSQNPPPFPGETESPFNVTNSPSVDKHLLVPFCNVATLGEDGFVVSDFAVNMTLVLAPEGASTSGLQTEWEVVEANPQMSGSLVPLAGLAARFANPKQGGVYRFRARVNGSPWTGGNVVLPLCGASIDATFDSDMAALTAIMTALRDNMAWYQKQDEDFGNLYFYMANAMDYVGRVDNGQWPTVWKYNQIDESLLTGYYRMGAVAMFRGVPTRVAKLGNFMAAYGTKTVGVWEILRMMSQWKGSSNDTTATMSWNAGTDVALGSNLVERTSALALDMWPLADIKVRRLWPNVMSADNHIETSDDFDYNRFFASPGTVRKSRTWLVPAQD